MKKEIEASGASVDEAIQSGLSKLRLNREEVDVEILDEGRRAILGIGGRDALVRLTASTSPEIEQQADQLPEPMIEIPPAKFIEAAPVVSKEKQAAVVDEPSEVSTEVLTTNEAEAAVTLMRELLGLMQVEAAVSSHLTEPDDLTGKQLNVVDINGDDLGVLIGPRGETLDALQYISRLMVGHRTRQRANFVIDIEGYRDRREQALSRLAERMASKAVKRGSPVTLEAMPANERRIIHIALRKSEEVRTESTGEGNRRRVRIYPT